MDKSCKEKKMLGPNGTTRFTSLHFRSDEKNTWNGICPYECITKQLTKPYQFKMTMKEITPKNIKSFKLKSLPQS